jgi:hypothetical protein
MVRILIAATLLLFVFACSREARPQDVEQAAALFFERLKGAEYDTIFNEASEQFKSQVSKDTMLDNLKQVTAIGRIQNYQRLSLPFESDKENQIASPVYAVYFDQGITEMTLNFKGEGGKWKLLGFSLKRRMPQ